MASFPAPLRCASHGAWRKSTAPPDASDAATPPSLHHCQTGGRPVGAQHERRPRRPTARCRDVGGAGMKGGGGRLGVTATLAAALPRQRIGTGRRVREWGAAGALVVRPLGQMPTGGGTGGTRDGAQRWGGRAVGRKGRRRLRGGTHRYESCYERGPPACHGITITEAVAVDDESGSRCKISCLPPVSRSRAHRACNIAASWQTPSPGHAPV